MSVLSFGLQDEKVSQNERQFIREAMQESLRIDGRGLYDYRSSEIYQLNTHCRSLRITFGQMDGQVQIQLGRTRSFPVSLILYLTIIRVYVMTSCSVVEPLPDRATEGFFTFAVDFSPIASPAYQVGRKTAAGFAEYICPLIH